MALYTDTSGATITTMVPSYLDRVFLDRLVATLSYMKHGAKKNLPKNEGGVIVWHQLKNPGNGYTLDETSVPGTSAVSTRKVSATIVYKAQLIDVTTRVDELAVNPVVKEIIDTMGYNAALTLDNYVSDVIGFGSAASTGLANASSTKYPSVFTQGFPIFEPNRVSTFWAAIGMQNGFFSAVPTIAHVRRSVTELKKLNARPFDDGNYRGIVDPTVSDYIRADSNFATWMAYTKRAAMERGMLGVVEKVLFEESSQAMTVAVLSSTYSGYVSGGGTLRGTLIFGKNAYGVTKLKGQDTKVRVVKGADKSDPLDQHTYIGYKIAIAAQILDPSAGIIMTYYDGT